MAKAFSALDALFSRVPMPSNGAEIVSSASEIFLVNATIAAPRPRAKISPKPILSASFSRISSAMAKIRSFMFRKNWMMPPTVVFILAFAFSAPPVSCSNASLTSEPKSFAA